MKFKDLYKFVTIAARYEKLLLDEQEMKSSSRGSYYNDPNLEFLITDYDMDFGKVDIAKLTCKRPVVCKALHWATKGTNSTLAIKKQTFEVG